MSIAAAQASAFFREIGAEGRVWTLEDDGGVPAPRGTDGHRAMPFWSRRSRVERIIATVPAYARFRPREVSGEDFVGRWLPGLARDGLLVGLSWSGPRAQGHDFAPENVLTRLNAPTGPT